MWFHSMVWLPVRGFLSHPVFPFHPRNSYRWWMSATPIVTVPCFHTTCLGPCISPTCNFGLAFNSQNSKLLYPIDHFLLVIQHSASKGVCIWGKKIPQFLPHFYCLVHEKWWYCDLNGEVQTVPAFLAHTGVSMHFSLVGKTRSNRNITKCRT